MMTTAALAVSLLIPGAHAAPPTDVAVDIVTPASAPVYGTTSYDIDVSNVSNKRARGVELVVLLPETDTSPTVHVMGTLSGVDARCTQVGTELECSLGNINAGATKTVSFDISLPQADKVLEVGALVDTSNTDSNPNNDSDTDVAPLTNYAVTVSPGDTASNLHCTGTNLTSYFECTLFPSSISGHAHDFLSGGQIGIQGLPAYGGTWSQATADSLEFTYTWNGQLVLEFEGYGTSGNCFEGISTFPNSGYVSPYEVCI